MPLLKSINKLLTIKEFAHRSTRIPFCYYARTNLLKLFLPLLTRTPLRSCSSVTVALKSVIFSPSTETPPCSIARLPSEREGIIFASTRRLLTSILPSTRAWGSTLTVGVSAESPLEKSALDAALARSASSSSAYSPACL